MDKNKNYLQLKKFSLNLGLDLFGVGDISGVKKEFAILPDLLMRFDKAVSLGIGLSGAVLSEISDRPTRLYFHHYRTANAILDQMTFRVSGYIQKKGFLALPIPASQILDWQKQTAHLSHKQIGVLAGLGWIGRNNLLVNDKLGSRIRLATILTNMPLKADKPFKTGCGVCRRCLEICPAGAIKERVQDFDHIKCFEKLKEFQKQRLVDQYICGVCVHACGGK